MSLSFSVNTYAWSWNPADWFGESTCASKLSTAERIAWWRSYYWPSIHGGGVQTTYTIKRARELEDKQGLEYYVYKEVVKYDSDDNVLNSEIYSTVRFKQCKVEKHEHEHEHEHEPEPIVQDPEDEKYTKEYKDFDYAPDDNEKEIEKLNPDDKESAQEVEDTNVGFLAVIV